MSDDRIRNAALGKRPKPRRVYKTVGVAETDGGFAVLLDGRPALTPKRRPLRLPSRALAAAIRDEWDAQTEFVDPGAMPFTQLANTATDGVAVALDAVLDVLAEYGRADLLCYRAEWPRELAAQQAEIWQPLLDWAERCLGVRLRVTAGVMAIEQPDESLAAIRAAFAGYDAWRLAAAQALAGAFGSVVLALAVIEGEIAAEAAFAASRLDETHQAKTWGEDAEARRRVDAIAAEVAAAAAFATLAAMQEAVGRG